jgi:hypothetical protein
VSGRLTVIWLTLTVGAAVGLFALKFEVQDLEGELAALNDSIFRDLDAIHVLKAEWSYLNRPASLQRRAGRHLELRPLQASQIRRLEDLPPTPDHVLQTAAGPPDEIASSATLVGARLGE